MTLRPLNKAPGEKQGLTAYYGALKCTGRCHPIYFLARPKQLSVPVVVSPDRHALAHNKRSGLRGLEIARRATCLLPRYRLGKSWSTWRRRGE